MVLIVDDDLAITRLMALVLRTEGYEVEVANSGREALLMLEAGVYKPSAILLDLMMPEVDGRAFFRQARQSGYHGPIVFCSAFGAADACLELGGQGAIDKPFDPDRLVSVVRSVVSESA